MDDTLTRDALLGMDAGHELDAGIAALIGWSNFSVSGLSGLLYGSDPEDHQVRPVPQYSADIEAALALPIENGMHYEIAVYSDASFSVILHDAGWFPYRCPDWKETLSLAERIVRAWCEWRLRAP